MFLWLDAGRRIVPCGLLRGDRRFAGMTREEVRDARAVRALSNRVHRGDAMSAEAAFRAEIEAIEREARERIVAPGAARGHPDVSDIRAARQAERRALHRADAWRPDETGETDAATGGQDAHGRPGEPAANGGYVPPPTDLAILAAVRARQWRGEVDR